MRRTRRARTKTNRTSGVECLAEGGPPMNGFKNAGPGGGRSPLLRQVSATEWCGVMRSRRARTYPGVVPLVNPLRFAPVGLAAVAALLALAAASSAANATRLGPAD